MDIIIKENSDINAKNVVTLLLLQKTAFVNHQNMLVCTAIHQTLFGLGELFLVVDVKNEGLSVKIVVAVITHQKKLHMYLRNQFVLNVDQMIIIKLDLLLGKSNGTSARVVVATLFFLERHKHQNPFMFLMRGFT